MDTDNVEPVAPAEIPQPENFVEVITNMLQEAGHPAPQAWQAGLDPDTFATNNPSIQRFLINRTLRLVLSQVPGTMDQRYCLVDTGDYKDWLRLVKQNVVPCLVKHNLPK